MKPEIVIKVCNITKTYEIFERPIDRLKNSFSHLLFKITRIPTRDYSRKFTALREINFEVSRGESFAIIGKNGSGKSTLLQLITGTLTPSEGGIQVGGRIGALLELGSGFNPEFSGLENIYLNGAILGLSSSEISSKIDSIIEFSEIGDFINQAVKTYSSGMMLRLAFSVIAHIDADILIVDEALAVGDIFFSQKCFRFFEEFKKNGGTLLFVSHDIQTVLRLCERALLLKNGQMVSIGASEAVCTEYIESDYGSRKELENNDGIKAIEDGDGGKAKSTVFINEKHQSNKVIASNFLKPSKLFGDGGAEITDVWFEKSSEKTNRFETDEVVNLFIKVKPLKLNTMPAIGFAIKNNLGQHIFTESTTFIFKEHVENGELLFRLGDIVTASFKFRFPNLNAGEYTMDFAIAKGFGHDHIQQQLLYDAIILNISGKRLVHGISGTSELTARILIEGEM